MDPSDQYKRPFPQRRTALYYRETNRDDLRADGDPILDQVEGFFWYDVLRHQFALHPVGTIAHDAIGLILLQSQEENHVVGRDLIDVHRG
jgi:hypothetical protein